MRLANYRRHVTKTEDCTDVITYFCFQIGKINYKVMNDFYYIEVMVLNIHLRQLWNFSKNTSKYLASYDFFKYPCFKRGLL